MASAAPVLNLSNELLRDILDFVEADPDQLVTLDRRGYLSQESFRPPTRPPRDQAKDLGNFRLTCRRFSELGAIHQYARITTRFSHRGFDRLEWLASKRHLARNVRKFSYMVPVFYSESREHAQDRLMSLQSVTSNFNAIPFIQKAAEQDDITNQEVDLKVLTKAFIAFTSLQHVQILRVQDAADESLLRLLRQHETSQRPSPRWSLACSHSTKTVGTALLKSQSPCSRFSSPQVSLQSARVLASRNPQSLALLVQRLTSLELHFDEQSMDLDEQMMELSGLFKTVFENARNMQAVHLGFPSHRPLNLKLEAVFHNVRWERLSAFGIQAWKLSSEEIISIASRHGDRLRGLRLRDVLLTSGRWKDVLRFLRDDMPRLDWVSLRRIGYAKSFDETLASSGFEVTDMDPPWGTSESDESDESDLNSTTGSDSEPDNDISDSARNSRQSSVIDGEDDDDGDTGPSAHQISLPLLPVNASPSTSQRHNRDPVTHATVGALDDLGDDGISVSNTQRKIWEKWVVQSKRNR